MTTTNALSHSFAKMSRPEDEPQWESMSSTQMALYSSPDHQKAEENKKVLGKRTKVKKIYTTQYSTWDTLMDVLHF